MGPPPPGWKGPWLSNHPAHVREEDRLARGEDIHGNPIGTVYDGTDFGVAKSQPAPASSNNLAPPPAPPPPVARHPDRGLPLDGLPARLVWELQKNGVLGSSALQAESPLERLPAAVCFFTMHIELWPGQCMPDASLSLSMAQVISFV